MARIILSIIILIHGLIHLLGFVKEWELGEVKGMTGKTLFAFSEGTAKMMGILWLIACLLFVFSAAAYFFKQDWWWMIAAAAFILSQVLIIIYWQDAKYGTIANVIVLIACILAYGSWDFSRMVKREVPAFTAVSATARSAKEKKIITEEMISCYPPVVQKWLRHSGIIGKEMIRTVRLTQTGRMKTTPDGNWMDMNAEQYFTVDKPGFHWTAQVKASPFLELAGRDKYENGHGNMLIKLFSLVPVVDAKGDKIDQGTMIRFMAEAAWFPAFALSSYIQWEEVDSLSARATMTYGGITASGVFKFTKDGDMKGFEAQRYFDRKEGATLETWSIYDDDDGYKEFEGIRIPAKSTVTWKLKTGDFTWLKLEILDVKYN